MRTTQAKSLSGLAIWPFAFICPLLVAASFYFELPFLVIPALIGLLPGGSALITFFYNRLKHQSEEAAFSLRQLQEQGLGSEQLFTQNESRERLAFTQFSKTASIFWGLIQGLILAASYGLWQFTDGAWLIPQPVSGAAAGGLLISALIPLLLGAYFSAFKEEVDQLWLRAVTLWLFFFTVTSIFCAIILYFSGATGATSQLSGILEAIFKLLVLLTAIEQLLNPLLQCFIPANPGRAPAFQSRLLQALFFPLLSLRYLQETWRYLAESRGESGDAVPAFPFKPVLLHVGLLFLTLTVGSCFYQLQPGQFAVETFCGKFLSATAADGWYMKAPWGLGQVHYFPDGPQQLTIDGDGYSDSASWVPADQPSNFYLLGRDPQSRELRVMTLDLRYTVTDPAQFYFFREDPVEYLELFARQMLTRLMISAETPVWDATFSERFLYFINGHLAEQNVGVEITSCYFSRQQLPDALRDTVYEDQTLPIEVDNTIRAAQLYQPMSPAPVKTAVPEKVGLSPELLEAHLGLYQIHPTFYSWYLQSFQLAENWTNRRKFIVPYQLKSRKVDFDTSEPLRSDWLLPNKSGQ